MREMLQSVLARLGSTVETVYECGDGEGAIDLYRNLRPDWVLMDIRLPGMNGLQATRSILRGDPGAKILIVTQYNEPSYREEAEAAGARGFVLKENLTRIPRFLQADNSSTGGTQSI